MNIQFTGKNVDLGQAYKSYVQDKLSNALEKYVSGEVKGHVRLAKERSQFRTGCTLRLQNGVILQASGDASDAYTSADAALTHLEKRARRYGRRLKSHHGSAKGPLNGKPPRDYTDRVDSAGEIEFGTNPVIVAEVDLDIPEVTVGEAVRRLDLTESSFLVFKTASDGDLNVVYRRSDGNIGWIEPRPGVAGSSSKRTGNSAVREQS